jgi:hypothetical protein
MSFEEPGARKCQRFLAPFAEKNETKQELED